MKPEFSLPFTQ